MDPNAEPHAALRRIKKLIRTTNKQIGELQKLVTEFEAEMLIIEKHIAEDGL